MEIISEKKLRILIAEDHKFVLELVKLYLSADNKFKTIDTAVSINDMVKHLDLNDYDVVLFVVFLKDGIITEGLANIKKLCKNAKMILFSGTLYRKIFIEAFKSGVQGFILKSSHQSEIKEAIDIILKGDKYYSKECVNLILEDRIEKQEIQNYIDESEILTLREKEILQFIINEFTVKEIAEKLNISHRTAETHKKNIMAKYKAKTTLGLVKKVLLRKSNKVDQLF